MKTVHRKSNGMCKHSCAHELYDSDVLIYGWWMRRRLETRKFYCYSDAWSVDRSNKRYSYACGAEHNKMWNFFICNFLLLSLVLDVRRCVLWRRLFTGYWKSIFSLFARGYKKLFVIAARVFFPSSYINIILFICVYKNIFLWCWWWWCFFSLAHSSCYFSCWCFCFVAIRLFGFFVLLLIFS